MAPASGMAVATTWLASTSHVACDLARLRPSHASCSAPSSVRSGAVRAAQWPPRSDVPQGWSARYWRGGGRVAGAAGTGAALVDIVAEVHDEVGVILRGEGPGRPEPVLLVLARREQEAQVVAAPRRGGGAGATDGADLVVHHEPVVVPGVGAQALDVDVDRVSPGRRGRGGPLADDVAEALVGCDLPPDRHIDGRQAAPP